MQWLAVLPVYVIHMRSVLQQQHGDGPFAEDASKMKQGLQVASPTVVEIHSRPSLRQQHINNVI